MLWTISLKVTVIIVMQCYWKCWGYGTVVL